MLIHKNTFEITNSGINPDSDFIDEKCGVIRSGGVSGRAMEITHRATISENNIFIDQNSCWTGGIATWKGSDNRIFDNVFDFGSLNGRAIILDSDADRNEVYSNHFIMRCLNGDPRFLDPASTRTLQSSAIQIRGPADDNKIYNNVVEISPDSRRTMAVRYGGTAEEDGSGMPGDNLIHHNRFSSNYRVINVGTVAGGGRFDSNTLVPVGDAMAISISAKKTIEGLIFSNEVVENRGAGQSTITIRGPSDSSVSNLRICGFSPELSEQDIDTTVDNWGTLNGSSCLEPVEGSDPPPPPPPPSRPLPPSNLNVE